MIYLKHNLSQNHQKMFHAPPLIQFKWLCMGIVTEMKHVCGRVPVKREDNILPVYVSNLSICLTLHYRQHISKLRHYYAREHRGTSNCEGSQLAATSAYAPVPINHCSIGDNETNVVQVTYIRGASIIHATAAATAKLKYCVNASSDQKWWLRVIIAASSRDDDCAVAKAVAISTARVHYTIHSSVTWLLHLYYGRNYLRAVAVFSWASP